MDNAYNGPERREFIRLDYASVLAYKVCSKETVSKLLRGYTSNVSRSGLLCNIKERVNKDDLLWVSFDRATLNICEEIESRAFVYQNGIVGKVVRIEDKGDGYNVGVHFLTREEKNLTHIYPKIHFITEDASGQKE